MVPYAYIERSKTSHLGTFKSLEDNYLHSFPAVLPDQSMASKYVAAVLHEMAKSDADKAGITINVLLFIWRGT